MKTIRIPDQVRERKPVLSLSGGKDSVAASLAMREAGVPHIMVFADTGWESPVTYQHLSDLERLLGPIERVGVPGGMVGKIRSRAGFPARLQRWCTTELKLEPIKKFHEQVEQETGLEVVSVVGIRREESKARSTMAEFEDDDIWGGYVWRPLIDWTIEDVILIHRRHGVPMNPLYHLGHDRVGCYPCVMASKEEIRLIADEAPWRIKEIRDLEQYVTEERARRNAEHLEAAKSDGSYEDPHEEIVPYGDERDDDPSIPPQVVKRGYTHPVGSFFQHRTDDAGVQSIDDVVAWSKTSRGGRQLPMFDEPSGGCYRWGLCERPDKG